MHFVHFSCCRSSVWVFFGPRPFHWDRKKKGLEMLIAQVFDNNAQKPAPRTNILFFNLAGSGKWTFDSSRYKARKCNNRDLHLAWNHNSRVTQYHTHGPPREQVFLSRIFKRLAPRDPNAQKPAPRTFILFFNLEESGRWKFDSSRYKARE